MSREAPLPPWVQFHDRPHGDRFWQTGDGHHYLMNVWYPYWQGLSREAKLEYLKKHDAPNDWRDALVFGVEETEGGEF